MQKKLAVFLAMFVVILATGCDAHDRVLRSEEHIYEFDGSQPVQKIVLTPVSATGWDRHYTPQLRSLDYLELAHRVLPPPKLYGPLQLTLIDTYGHHCDRPDQFDRMRFEWIAPYPQTAGLHVHFLVAIDASAGNMISVLEERANDTQIDPVPAIQEGEVESIMQSAHAAFLHTDGASLLQAAGDCVVEAHVLPLSPPVWQVGFRSSSLMHTDTYVVDSTDMVALRKP
jgi:hypothetical protein